ncbi:MAG: MaoC/PaaZ C-terminal domain-containing protein [Pseudomonadales bacterium]
MAKKVVIQTSEDFQDREGQTLFVSEPVLASKERIQQYCQSVNQMDWFHWDEERCKQSPFGAIVAPGMFTLSLIHSVYFENVELRGLRALFLGSDRFRILKPVTAGSELRLTFDVQKIEIRDHGFAVHYSFTWNADGNEQPVTLGNFIVRYWEEHES